MLNRRVMFRSFTVDGVIQLRMNKVHKNDILCLGTECLRHAFFFLFFFLFFFVCLLFFLAPKMISLEIHDVFINACVITISNYYLSMGTRFFFTKCKINK